jgi:hypothetical protein
MLSVSRRITSEGRMAEQHSTERRESARIDVRSGTPSLEQRSKSLRKDFSSRPGLKRSLVVGVLGILVVSAVLIFGIPCSLRSVLDVVGSGIEAPLPRRQSLPERLAYSLQDRGHAFASPLSEFGFHHQVSRNVAQCSTCTEAL